MNPIPESYYSNRTRQKGLSMFSSFHFKRNVIYAGGWWFLILFAKWDVILQFWSPSLHSYSAGKANIGSPAAIAEQPATTLLV